MKAAEARERMAPFEASIRRELERAPELPPEAVDILRATGLARHLPAPAVREAS